jgi:hypothetical protein
MHDTIIAYEPEHWACRRLSRHLRILKAIWRLGGTCWATLILTLTLNLTWIPVYASLHQPVLQNLQRNMNVYACSFLLVQVVG